VCSWTHLTNLENTQLTHIEGLHTLFLIFFAKYQICQFSTVIRDPLRLLSSQQLFMAIIEPLKLAVFDQRQSDEVNLQLSATPSKLAVFDW